MKIFIIGIAGGIPIREAVGAMAVDSTTIDRGVPRQGIKKNDLFQGERHEQT